VEFFESDTVAIPRVGAPSETVPTTTCPLPPKTALGEREIEREKGLTVTDEVT
jgi:hypothetical protein